MARKQQQKIEEVYAQVIPVVACADEAQIERIMHLCAIPRALTYNKLGSLQGWEKDWRKADPIVRSARKPSDIGLPAKLWEWSVSDAMKAIGAQQEAAKSLIARKIEERTKDEAERARLLNLLHNSPTTYPWLHRQFRQLFVRGHTFVRNQIVYQNSGYKCKRLTRNTVVLQVAALNKGCRISLKLKCRHIISGQIRLIRNQFGQLEVHCTRKRTLVLPSSKPDKQIGIDQGYTEAFYTSDGDKIADGLGQLMTAKTHRITRSNRNRYRLRSYAANHPEKAENIRLNNLGHKVKSRRLQREKATIQNFIRQDLRRKISAPTQIFVEDLSRPITRKQQAKHINRLLNQWMKGELQASIEKIALETGSTVSAVNPAYTSQVDSLTGTLLGQREGDRFIRHTGDAIQADENAARNVLHRGSDSEITRWMKYAEVRQILIRRTVWYLASIGKSVAYALELGWLNSKFRAEAIELEADVTQRGAGYG
ncbi:zinc ribbon domain-containing protein [Microseira wollei]|uniref:zinc ribbon domain-containing protein n=1 Tax=Microseira wollei TaxID=467598 RepID=UPI001CFF1D8C|nr:zinc ribbon domain-containing protein [Microseira wollei]